MLFPGAQPHSVFLDWMPPSVELAGTAILHAPKDPMETAVGAANWLVGKLLNKLSQDLVAAYVASSELGLNSDQIKTKLKYMQGLLHVAQERDASTNAGLQSLLEDLSKKADEAEDALDELHYFMIQDHLDGTQEAAPDLGDDLHGHALHGRHAARHTIGNCLRCFCCSPTKDDDDNDCVADTTKSDSGSGKLPFDRVAMSNRIKSVMESIHDLCDPVSDLLTKIPNNSNLVTVTRPPTSSTAAQDKLYGRSVLFENTVDALTNGTYHTETLSVLSFVGPGGIGKTTFAQHLYNDERVQAQFTVKVWVCVSTDFDVLKLTRQIHSCIPGTGNEEKNTTAETSNLDQLQKSIAQKLKSRRFLIVQDDIWKCNSEGEWKNLLAPFTKGETKGNMVLVTTRFPFIAHMVTRTDPVELHGLEPNDFFMFFEECIFGHRKPQRYDDELADVARDIAKKLKGSPLAANTVGRLLRKNLSREYWMGVLEKNEWKNPKKDDDIMPSLKISYDYLPYRLKKCFSYFALFPEDYRFYTSEITRFWIAIGIVDASCKDDSNFLEELVDYGFLMEGGDGSRQFYVMHDLLHELSRNVSSHECGNISSLSFTADSIPRSIQHLSITIQDIYDESFGEEMGKLKGMVDIEKLRTLMIFGYHNARVANILKDTFETIKNLRVLSIAMNTEGSLPNSFSNLIHLQYLKISSPDGLKMALPSALSRFYHLKFLNLEHWHGSENFPKEFTRLVNLCHINSSKELHSNIPEVGKVTCLQELKEFHVKKESLGFELAELGELTELGGELCIRNLERVASKEEASGAKLKKKKNLKELMLVWGIDHLTVDDDVLEGLEPHPNIRVLDIINPGGVSAGSSWLYGNISTKNLESLHLEGVSWDTLPPFEQLPYLMELSFKNVGMRMFGPGFGGVTERSFMHLKTIMFADMPELVEWVGAPNSHWFSRLESIECSNCPFLRSFPFLQYSGRFTRLSNLYIDDCPKLPQFPPVPHTCTLTSMTLVFSTRRTPTALRNKRPKLTYNGDRLTIHGYNGALVFHNMDKLKSVYVSDVSHVSLSELQSLHALTRLSVKKCDSMFTAAEVDGSSVVHHSVRSLALERLCIQGEVFSGALKCFPAVSNLAISSCHKLALVPTSGEDLSKLQCVNIRGCTKMFSRWSTETQALEEKPFPPSLRSLKIHGNASMGSMAPLSNLTCLTVLSLVSCGGLTMDGFNPLITVNLVHLSIHNSRGNSIAADLLSEVARSKLMRAGSFQLGFVQVDSMSALLVAPVCRHLAGTLHSLHFTADDLMESFTEEQEQALQLLTSLQQLTFATSRALQSLPQGLHHLSSLRSLRILDCHKIQSLPPKEGLPTSLRAIQVYSCGPEITEQANKLKGTDSYFSALLDVR